MKEPAPLQQVDRTYVRCRGRKLSYFSGCDYFRLASHPAVGAALQSGLKKFGLNVAASRLTTGNHALYGQLERRLTEFFEAEAALLLTSGYLTAMAVAQALAGTFTHALLDERAHLCLWDAARFLACPFLKFKHRDPQDLGRVLRRCGAKVRPAVLTDGMFAHDGGVAPLREYLSLLPANAVLVVDDAHGAGVLGRTGKGALEETGVPRRQIIQTITLSKAFGVYGGVILGSRQLRDQLLARSPLVTGATPLPLPLVCAALKAIDLLATDASLRRRLRANTDHVKKRLRELGFQLPDTPGPILALHPRGPRVVPGLKRRLWAARIYPPLSRYGHASRCGYFRFVLSSEHTREQLNHLVEVLDTNRRAFLAGSRA